MKTSHMSSLPLIAHTAPDAVLAWRHDVAVSAGQFLHDVERLAALMPAGGHVLNLCRDRYRFAVGFAAAIVARKVSLLPPAHTPEMVRQLRGHTPDLFCLYDDDNACADGLPLLRYPAMPELAGPAPAVPHIAADQLIAIVFTSGSTGTPQPHRKHWDKLVRCARAQAALLGLDNPADGQYAVLGTVPPQHMYGLESTVLLPLLNGHCLSSRQPFYAADICAALDALPMRRVLVSAPLHLRMLLDSELALPAADLVLSATAPLSVQLAQCAETRFGAPLFEIYGSTETGQIATRRTTRDSHWQLFPEVRLVARGERVWAQHGHIEAAVALNDIVECLDETRFLLHGRLQDMVNIAGKRNSLLSLNHQLNSIPGVLDGAFYMPDDSPTEAVTRLAACVVAPGLSAAAVLAALRERVDPVFLPRPLVFVDALPRNSTGKLPRAALKRLIDAHGRGPLVDAA